MDFLLDRARKARLDAVAGRSYKPWQSPFRRRHCSLRIWTFVLKQIFTWWTGATIGARHQIISRSAFVGEDETGNRYYETRDKKWNYDGRNRRFVIYKGYPDASKVSPDWHGWLHHTFEEPPTRAPLKRQAWEKDHRPNLTGTLWAWRPKGAISQGGDRSAATGDYQPWTPD